MGGMCDYHRRGRPRRQEGEVLNANSMRARRETSRSLGAVFEVIRPRLELVDHFIRRELHAGPPAVREIGDYVFGGGGKRLRPALLLVVSRMLGYQGDSDVRYGAVIEMIHTATLIHDDIIDHAQVRRGRPTANNRWGNQLTVLLGDWLYARSIDLALEADDVAVMKVLSKATVGMIEGEILGQATCHRADVTREQYLEIVGHKTGELFAAACSIPALFMPEYAPYRAPLATYGYNLGVCFQIVDDVLDIRGSEQRLGKPVFSDLREGKITLPFILAWPHLDPSQRLQIEEVLTTGELSSTSPAELRALLDSYDVIDEAVASAAAYGRIAEETLATLPEGLERDALAGAPRFLLERDT